MIDLSKLRVYEKDGRWWADSPEIPGFSAVGETKEAAENTFWYIAGVIGKVPSC